MKEDCDSLGSHGNVPAVDHLQARQEGVDLQPDVVAAVKAESPGPRANASRSEASTRAVRRASILVVQVNIITLRRRGRTYEGCPDESDVEGFVDTFAAETVDPRKLSKCRDPRENGRGCH
jgi:hypothetical protein